MKERAIAVLASLHRNSNAMNVLRSKLESRISSGIGNGSSAESCQELTRVLILVKNGETILNELTLKVESARFLEEFIQIIDSASASFCEIKNDMQELVPIAEAALSEMHDTLAVITPGMAMELKQEIDLSVLAQASAAINERNQASVSTAEGHMEVAAPPRDSKCMQEIEAEGVPI